MGSVMLLQLDTIGPIPIGLLCISGCENFSTKLMSYQVANLVYLYTWS